MRREPAAPPSGLRPGPGNDAAPATIAGFGFIQVGELCDEDDGPELLFERPAPASS